MNLRQALRPAWDGLRRHRAGRWPLPALLSWGLAWGSHLALLGLAGRPAPAWVAAALLGGALALLQSQPWRRAIVALGFPLSSLVLGWGTAVPAWAWLLPLGLLALAYPARTWRDAPWYPTPARALDGLAQAAVLPPQARVLDVGCGLGHGLRALGRQYPHARLEGVEWSAALCGLATLWCPRARVRRADMWADDWRDYDMVYLFQRPESMVQALEKARREMRPGSWLVSLAFEVPGQPPTAQLHTVAGRSVWLYRIDGPRASRRAAQVA